MVWKGMDYLYNVLNTNHISSIYKRPIRIADRSSIVPMICFIFLFLSQTVEYALCIKAEMSASFKPKGRYSLAKSKQLH